jgi:hypothetical protein
VSFVFIHVISRLIAFLLIAESLFGALYVSSLIAYVGSYDGVAIALILGRGLLGALQFIAGWLLANRRPAGSVLARFALVAGAVHVILSLGFNLAPTDIYYWYRWHVTAAYCAYALIAVLFLSYQPAGTESLPHA